MRFPWTRSVCAGAVLLMGALAIQAAPLFSETFDTDVPDEATFFSTYGQPPWNLYYPFEGNPISVVNGVFQIKELINITTAKNIGVPGYNKVTYPELLVQADVGTTTGNGWYLVGFSLGEVYIRISPGYAGGGLGIDNAWGGGDVAWIDMGFTPANNVMHKLKVLWKQNTGEFDITVTDGANPANVFNYSWSDPSAAGAGGKPIALHRYGPDDKLPQEGISFHDNFVIDIPEPASLLLLGLMLPLVRRRPLRA